MGEATKRRVDPFGRLRTGCATKGEEGSGATACPQAVLRRPEEVAVQVRKLHHGAGRVCRKFRIGIWLQVLHPWCNHAASGSDAP
jgi:hypothetical protein